MNRRFVNFIQVILGCLDLFTLNLILFLYSLVLGSASPGILEAKNIQILFFLNGSWLFVCWIMGVYQEKNIKGFESFSRSSMKAFIVWVTIFSVSVIFVPQFDLSRSYIFAVIGSFAFMLLTNRFIYLILHNYYSKQDYLIKKVLILGYNEVSKKLITYLEEDGMNTQIVGFCDEMDKVQELTHYPIISPISEAKHTWRSFKVNEVFSTVSPEQHPGIYKLMQEADQECIRFKLIPDLSYFIKGHIHIDYFKDMPVLSLRSEPLDEISSRIKKRLFDIIVSFFVTVFILSWLIPIIALIIRLESKGPVFFFQKRSGKDNQTFNCIKFRSMFVNPHADVAQARKDDSRLTKVGKFLRKTNLDEFPQFLNVLKGTMSIVGPRPHMLKHTSDYSQLINKYMVRQFLKPGITGWAQVNGLRGETKTIHQMQQRVEHDIWYMENWSLWLDVRIMFLTIYTTIKGDENAF